MREKSGTTAQRLLNLYRNVHVISGGWAAVNQVFLAESDADVLAELPKLPTGALLAAHIKNLKSGATPLDSIAAELMPYGGTMPGDFVTSESAPEIEIQEFKIALDDFKPDEKHLDEFKKLRLVRRYGAEWFKRTRGIFRNSSEYLDKLNTVHNTFRAYELWASASAVMADDVISERERGMVQADLPEYETYLPMFGADGLAMLAKLRTVGSA